MSSIRQAAFTELDAVTVYRLMRLRVIGIHGTLPGPVRGLVRFVALCLSVMPAGLGWLWCLFDRERRALHDHLAGTYVVVDESRD